MSYLEGLFGLHGQVALITGGTRGIGQTMALALARAGADILLVQVRIDTDPPYQNQPLTSSQRDTTNKSTHDQITALGRKCMIYTADLASQESVVGLLPRILADDHKITILLNCAGIQRRHPSDKFPSADWDEVLQVNLTTVFTMCRDVGAHMLSNEPDSAGRRGSIINIASLLSFQGGLTVPAYAASKGGIAQLTKALSNEWASKGIAVNAVAPGYIDTEMNSALMDDGNRASSILARIPAGRWGKPEDFEGAVVFLASRASGYVSGEVLTVDGGWMGR